MGVIAATVGCATIGINEDDVRRIACEVACGQPCNKTTNVPPQYVCPVPIPVPTPSPDASPSPKPPSPVPTAEPDPSPAPSPKPSPSPNPQATPATCPPLMRVGGGLYNCQRKGVPKPCNGELNAGDRVTLDSTHHFGRRTVASCDEPEDTACGGRMCDDTIGGTKFVIEAGANCAKSGTHQLTCAPLVTGRYRVRLCANDDYHDQLGQPVDTSRAECTLVEWDVRP